MYVLLSKLLHLGGGGGGGLSQLIDIAHERTRTRATDHAGTAGKKATCKNCYYSLFTLKRHRYWC